MGHRGTAACVALSSRIAQGKGPHNRAPQEKMDWQTLAHELEDYTCAEVEFLVNEAARRALEQKRAIVSGDILYAAGKTPPAHTAEMIEQMRTFQ